MELKDYYINTRSILDRYNYVQEKIKTSHIELAADEDEFLQNYCIHLAHALIKDTGYGQQSREELEKVADIINDVIR